MPIDPYFPEFSAFSHVDNEKTQPFPLHLHICDLELQAGNLYRLGCQHMDD
jgi:hypothetical protein